MLPIRSRHIGSAVDQVHSANLRFVTSVRTIGTGNPILCCAQIKSWLGINLELNTWCLEENCVHRRWHYQSHTESEHTVCVKKLLAKIAMQIPRCPLSCRSRLATILDPPHLVTLGGTEIGSVGCHGDFEDRSEVTLR